MAVTPRPGLKAFKCSEENFIPTYLISLKHLFPSGTVQVDTLTQKHGTSKTMVRAGSSIVPISPGRGLAVNFRKKCGEMR